MDADKGQRVLGVPARMLRNYRTTAAMTLPSRSEVEQTLASCTPEHVGVVIYEAGEPTVFWRFHFEESDGKTIKVWHTPDAGTKLYAAPQLLQLIEWVRSAQLNELEKTARRLRLDEAEALNGLERAEDKIAAQSERIAVLEKENEEHIELMDGFRKLYSRAWQEIPKSLQDELAKDVLHLITHRRANTARLDASGGSSLPEDQP